MLFVANALYFLYKTNHDKYNNIENPRVRQLFLKFRRFNEQ